MSPSNTNAEPIVFTWAGKELSLGYLGRFRWRVRFANAVVEAEDARDAAKLVLDHIFDKASPGNEVAQRAPVRVQEGRDAFVLDADTRMPNGWTCSSSKCRFDLGSHDMLLTFVADLLARNADTAWAVGVERVQPAFLGQEFAFGAFARATDPGELCRHLASILTQRLRESPHPATAFGSSMQELKNLGHDLWSWDADRVWGPDYATHRLGAGLTVTRSCGDGEDESPAEETVEVEFRPPT